MIAPGDILDVHIDDVAYGGDGVGRDADGRAVFVPFAAVGDQLKVAVTAAHPRYARGTIQEIVAPGKGRTVPRCPHFGRCGGCAYQHLDYGTELEAKKHQQVEALRRLGGLDAAAAPDPACPAPSAFAYRNKMAVRPLRPEVDASGARTVEYGYCERDNTTLFPLDSCPLAQPALNDLLRRAPETPLGKRNASARQPAPLTLRATSDGTTALFFGRAPKRVPWLHETLLGRPVSVPLGSFWQVNPPVADRVAETVAGWFGEQPTRNLVDAYSGVGTFSLAIGTAAHTRFLIESDEQAMAAARYNHEQWDGLACHSRADRTEHVLPSLLAGANLRRTTVLLDPPRQGCTPRVVQALRDFRPVQVIYVSCNPATLARDLKGLVGHGGYRLERLALFDMFPRTAHFESAVLLRHG